MKRNTSSSFRTSSRRLGATLAAGALAFVGAAFALTGPAHADEDEESCVKHSISGTLSLPVGFEEYQGEYFDISFWEVDSYSTFGTSVRPSDGSWEFDDYICAGQYRVSVSAPNKENLQINLASAWWSSGPKGAVNWEDAGIIDSTSGPLTGVDITMREGWIISGTVTVPEGLTSELPSVIPVAYNATRPLWMPPPEGLPSSITPPQRGWVDQAGNYQIVGLAPGDAYQVAFFPRGTANLKEQWWDGAEAQKDATPVGPGAAGEVIPEIDAAIQQAPQLLRDAWRGQCGTGQEEFSSPVALVLRTPLARAR